MTGTAVAMTSWSLIDAKKSQEAVKKLDGRAARLVAMANTRRELLRLISQVLMVAVVIPGLTVDRPVLLWTEAGPNWALIALMLIPLPIAANGVIDAIDRRRLIRIAAADIYAERRRRSTDLP